MTVVKALYLLLCSLHIHLSIQSGLCYQQKSDISNVLSGEWYEETNKYAGQRYGHYSREYINKNNITDLWWSEACPVQMTIFTCYRHDIDRLHGKGSESELRYFQPLGCDIEDFSPTKFLEIIRDRTILICCDSLSMQFYTELVCNLHGSTRSKYHIDWARLTGIFGPQDCRYNTGDYCHLNTAHVFYPEYNAHIKYIGTHLQNINGKAHGYNSLKDYQDYGVLRNNQKDILLLNFGVHFHSKSAYVVPITALVNEYLENRSKLPHVIWRETSPQHFKNPDGLFSREGRCVSYKDYEHFYHSNFYNRAIEEVFQQFNVDIPILRIYNSSKTEYFAHIDLQDRTDEKYLSDCTHFCQPSGVLNHWVELFYNAILLL